MASGNSDSPLKERSREVRLTRRARSSRRPIWGTSWQKKLKDHIKETDLCFPRDQGVPPQVQFKYCFGRSKKALGEEDQSPVTQIRAGRLRILNYHGHEEHRVTDLLTLV